MQLDIDQAHLDRFCDMFDVIGECWEWRKVNRHGRPFNFGVQGRIFPPYRWIYEQVEGEIPAGLEIDHLCNNAVCVNPDHLEAVTETENQLRYLEVRFGEGVRECRCVIRHVHGTAAMVRNHYCKCMKCRTAPGLPPAGALGGRLKNV